MKERPCRDAIALILSFIMLQLPVRIIPVSTPSIFFMERPCIHLLVHIHSAGI
jgi:hypothetical protein